VLRALHCRCSVNAHQQKIAITCHLEQNPHHCPYDLTTLETSVYPDAVSVDAASHLKHSKNKTVSHAHTPVVR